MMTLSSTTLLANDKTFVDVCSDCHTGGLKGWVSGTPNVRKAHKWKKFLERHSVEVMKDIVLNGSEDHKRKGGCKTCSDNDIVAALEYMLTLVK